MHKRQILNGVIVAAVVALVAAAAWYKSPRPPAEPSPTSAPAPALPRLLDLGAHECIPCKKMAPILRELEAEFKGRAIVDFIDVWKNKAEAEKYRVTLIPTQIFFDRQGKEVWRHVGFLSKEEIVTKFKELGVK
jgi:thioredoxin 1